MYAKWVLVMFNMVIEILIQFNNLWLTCLIVQISCISNVKKLLFDLVLSITQKMKIENLIFLPSAYFVLWWLCDYKNDHIPHPNHHLSTFVPLVW